jgi:hypothetical protein
MAEALRSNLPPNDKRPVVGLLDTQETVVTATLVGVMAFGQEEESTLRGPGVFFRRVSPEMLETLPVERFFRSQLALPAFGLGTSQ